jgi:hypothetical protein
MGPENVAEFGEALRGEAALTAFLDKEAVMWLAASIRDARVHLMPGDGHLSMTVSAFDRILDDLLDLAGLGATRA